jgi:hypothetical protein
MITKGVIEPLPKVSHSMNNPILHINFQFSIL